jgi:hypothetical protein
MIAGLLVQLLLELLLLQQQLEDDVVPELCLFL